METNPRLAAAIVRRAMRVRAGRTSLRRFPVASARVTVTVCIPRREEPRARARGGSLRAAPGGRNLAGTRRKFVEANHVDFEPQVRQRLRVARDELFLVAVEREIEPGCGSRVHDL